MPLSRCTRLLQMVHNGGASAITALDRFIRSNQLRNVADRELEH